MGIDLRHMLKVYNYVNDEKRPKVNLKFLGVFAAFLVAAGALTFFALTQSGAAPSPQAAAEPKREYVGFTAAEIANPGTALTTPQERLQAWYAAHPDARVERVEPVYDQGLLVGYFVTFRDA